MINSDRKRPFLEAPVYHGGSLSYCGDRYFQGKVQEFREKNKEFDLFLIGIDQEIRQRKITYCDNILLFIDGKAKVNWVAGTRSLFRILIKLYNYDYSPRQAVNHIEKCYTKYQRLLNDELKMGDEYEFYIARSHWDSSIKDFVEISLSPKRSGPRVLAPYCIRVKFCSLQIVESNIPDNPYPNSENEIRLIAEESTYDDALLLFDYCNGNHFARRIMDITVKELNKHDIIRYEPKEVLNKFINIKILLYSFNIRRYEKLKKDSK